MAKKVQHLDELYAKELADVVADEVHLAEAMELFRKAARNQVLHEILGRIENDARKLAETHPGLKAGGRKAIRGIIEEGQRRVKEIADVHLVDVELISTAQRLLGYQIASYRSVLPLARLMRDSDIVLLCQSAIDSKDSAIKLLSETGHHQVHWRASWWAPAGSTAWDKMKTLFREDWQRTKEHLGLASDSEEQDAPVVTMEDPAFRYGYGSAMYLSDREWDQETREMLAARYGGIWDPSTEAKIERGWHFARKHEAVPVGR